MTLELLLYFLSSGFFLKKTSFSDCYLANYLDILAESLAFPHVTRPCPFLFRTK